MKTTVVHKRNEHDVYIGRPSKWGNPYKLTDEAQRTTVIMQYAEWILAQPQLVEMCRTELAGKRLGCFCAPKQCHGDVLAYIANGGDLDKLQARLDQLKGEQK